jgi:hypothetical protein
MGHEADAATVVLIRRIVETVCFRLAVFAEHFWIANERREFGSDV